MVALPPELVDLILAVLAVSDDESSKRLYTNLSTIPQSPLKACSLVSRTWAPLAQGHLFSSIRIYGDQEEHDLPAFLMFLKDSRLGHLLRRMRILRVHGCLDAVRLPSYSQLPILNLVDLATVLAQLADLQTLWIIHWRLPDTSSLPDPPLLSPLRLEHLALGGLQCLGPVNHGGIMYIFRILSSIRALRITFLSSVGTSSPPPLDSHSAPHYALGINTVSTSIRYEDTWRPKLALLEQTGVFQTLTTLRVAPVSLQSVTGVAELLSRAQSTLRDVIIDLKSVLNAFFDWGDVVSRQSAQLAMYRLHENLSACPALHRVTLFIGRSGYSQTGAAISLSCISSVSAPNLKHITIGFDCERSGTKPNVGWAEVVRLCNSRALKNLRSIALLVINEPPGLNVEDVLAPGRDTPLEVNRAITESKERGALYVGRDPSCQECGCDIAVRTHAQ